MMDPEANTPNNPPQQAAEEFFAERDDADNYHGQPLTPEQKIKDPAIALLTIGAFFCFASLLTLVFFICGLINSPANSLAEAFSIAGILGAMVGLLYFGVMLLGAYGLLKMRNWGLAVAAAFLALLPLALAGVWGLLSGIFGFWALVILFQPDVRREFRRRKAKGYYSELPLSDSERPNPRSLVEDDAFDERADYDDHIGQPSTPAQKAKKPAVALLIVGALYALAALILLVYHLWEGIDARASSDQLDAFLISFWSLVGLIAVGFMIFGARCLFKRRGWGWALTAGIIAVLPMAVLGTYGILSGPFGLWALYVLLQPDVRREFRRPVA